MGRLSESDLPKRLSALRPRRRGLLLDKLKLITAGLLAFSALLSVVDFLGKNGAFETAPAAIGLLLGGFLIWRCAEEWRKFNPDRPVEADLTPRARNVRRMEQAGELEVEELTIRRAFAVEELGDEGAHYFLELEDGRALYLGGQYLWDYEEEDGSLRFPCGRFELRRHRRKAYTVDLVCHGPPLPLDFTAPSTAWDRAFREDPPEDGQFFPEGSYAELRARFLRRQAG